MILAIDSSTAACTAALFTDEGKLAGSRDEVIGRGHAERLVPMISELLDGRSVDRILVGVGPGSFTGIRVAIAAAHGLAIGWKAELKGMSSLALMAAAAVGEGPVAAAMAGGHGELFVQEFGRPGLDPLAPMFNLPLAEAARQVAAAQIVGPAAGALVAARGSGEAIELWPRAASALALPTALRTLEPKPLYARAPDARPRQAA